MAHTSAIDMEGHGKPVILINGWMRSRHEWPRFFIDRLAREFTVIRMSLRGMDSTGPCPSDITMVHLAQDCMELIKAQKLERVSVIGNSLGGMVAQVMAWSQPALFETVVLMSTSPPRIDGVRLPLARNPKRATTGSSRDQLAFERRGNSVATGSPISWNNTASLRSALMLLKAMLSHEDEERLADISAPCLVIHGARDSVIRPELGRRLAECVPNSRFVLMKDAGHDLVSERPVATAELVADFLKVAKP